MSEWLRPIRTFPFRNPLSVTPCHAVNVWVRRGDMCGTREATTPDSGHARGVACTYAYGHVDRHGAPEAVSTEITAIVLSPGVCTGMGMLMSISMSIDTLHVAKGPVRPTTTRCGLARSPALGRRSGMKTRVSVSTRPPRPRVGPAATDLRARCRIAPAAGDDRGRRGDFRAGFAAQTVLGVTRKEMREWG